MGTITHAHQTALPDNGRSDVSANVWNAGHTFSLTGADVGLGNVDNVSEATILAAAASAAAALYAPAASTRGSLTADTTINVPSQLATLDLALTYAAGIDFGGHTLTIQLANGSYSPAAANFVIPATVGQATPQNLLIKGDTTTPGNVTLTTNGTLSFSGIIRNNGSRCRVQGVKFVGSGNTFGIHCLGSGYTEFSACEFSTGMWAHLASEGSGTISAVGNYTVSAGCTVHVYAVNAGHNFIIGSTITISNTPAWIAGFAWADMLGFVRVAGGTSFSGSATGPRYSANHNGAIDTAGGGATYFPGDLAGTTGTGGLYA